MRNSILFPLVFFFGTLLSYSQPVYKHDLNRMTYSVSSSRDGGTLIGADAGAGGTPGTSNPGNIIKLNSTGDTIFSKCYTEHGGITMVRETHDNGLIAVGTIDTSALHYAVNPYIVRTDSIGNVLWSRQAPGIKREGFNEVIETTDHGFIAMGVSQSGPPVYYDVLIVKFDSVGTVVWSRTLGLTYDDRGYAIVELWNGNFAVYGETNSVGAGGNDLLLTMLDPTGAILWQEAIGTPAYDGAKDLVQAEDSTLVFSAFSNGDVWLTKVDLSGSILWTKRYDSGKSDNEGSLVKSADHGYTLAGGVAFGMANQAFLLHTDELGNPLWAKSYDDTIYYYAQIYLTQNIDNGYVMIKQKAMYMFTIGPGDVTKTDTMGNSCYSGPANFSVSSGTWTITPCSMSTGSFVPFSPSLGLTSVFGVSDNLVCASATGIQKLENNNTLFSVFPNPTNSGFRVSLPGPATGMELVLINLLGQEFMRIRIDQEEQFFSVDQLPVGIYSVQLHSKQGLVGTSLLSVFH